jgi:hypothetical protein
MISVYIPYMVVLHIAMYLLDTCIYPSLRYMYLTFAYFQIEFLMLSFEDSLYILDIKVLLDIYIYSLQILSPSLVYKVFGFFDSKIEIYLLRII